DITGLVGAPSEVDTTVPISSAALGIVGRDLAPRLERWYPNPAEPTQESLSSEAIAEVISVGITSYGDPYFAAYMKQKGSVRHGDDPAFSVLVLLDAMPIQRASPDEHHPILSYQAGPYEAYIAITPSGRIATVDWWGQTLETGIGVVHPNMLLEIIGRFLGDTVAAWRIALGSQVILEITTFPQVGPDFSLITP